jgi:hypothetical protein
VSMITLMEPPMIAVMEPVGSVPKAVSDGLTKRAQTTSFQGWVLGSLGAVLGALATGLVER